MSERPVPDRSDIFQKEEKKPLAFLPFMLKANGWKRNQPERQFFQPIPNPRGI